MRRREFLASGAVAAGALLTPAFIREALAAPAVAGESPYGPLQPPDANGVMLPPGFSSRLIARAMQLVPGTAYQLPPYPDGQAVFATDDGGWILVTNSESLAATGAGSSAIRFAPDGGIESAYRILGGTNVNCAGGPTPWGTWLSCEEHDGGMVWECEPETVLSGTARPAMGVFTHEAAAVDPVGQRAYMTEDRDDGGFYRFTPERYPSLSAGLLEVATVAGDGRVSWTEVPDPSGISAPTRHQVPGMTPFDSGEGIWYAADVLYFTTKGDKRVWAYSPRTETIEVLYDHAAAPDASLDAVDNVTVSSAGEIFVCEDGGNMEIGLITPDRKVSPFLRLPGPDHEGSEVCGVCFNPSEARMYLTSQRAYPAIPGEPRSGPGAVFEVSGPFRRSGAGGIATPLAGSRPPDHSAPTGLPVLAPERIRRRRLLRQGLPLHVYAPEGAIVSAALTTSALADRPGRGGSTRRPVTVILSRRRGLRHRGPGVLTLRLRPGRKGAVRLRRRSAPIRARLVVLAVDGSGKRRIAVRSVRVGAKSR